MTLKINGATGGSVSLDAPDNTSPAGTDVTLTLPTSAGSSGQYLQTNGSGTLSWQTVAELPDAIDVNASAPADSLNIDGSGRLLVGTTDSSGKHLLKVNGTTVGSTDAGAISLTQGRTAPPNGSAHGVINFGTETRPDGGAQIVAFADGAWTDGSSHPSGIYITTVESGSTSLTERMRINNEGRFYVPGVYNFGSGTSANVVVGTDGQIRRATSSQKYKTDIETLQDSYADALLECRPVWYRSLIADDNPNYSFYGFIAEEVAEIDPRLVEWKTVEISYDEKGSVVTTPCDPEPEGVQYDRFVPHLLNLIKRQKEQLESQAATIAALDARLTALEGGAA